jgi:hypothetical protein
MQRLRVKEVGFYMCEEGKSKMSKKWLISLVLCLAFLFGCVGTVINMPKQMPDIVSSYKSVTVPGNYAGMLKSGVQVRAGNYVIIMAKGEVDVWPAMRDYVFKPNRLLLYRLGKDAYAGRYYGYNGFRAGSSGDLYLGLVDGPMDPYGEPSKPDYYNDNRGYFVVDIIAWEKEDMSRIADFLAELSSNDPKNEELKYFATRHKYLKETQLAEEKAKKEAEKNQKVTVALKEKQIREDKEPEKEKQPPRVSDKKVEEVKRTEKPDTEKKEKPTVIYEAGKPDVSPIKKPLKPKDTSPPKITVKSPEIGKEIKVAAKTSRITVLGKATDESGIAEIVVNEEIAKLDEEGNFSANVLLKVGENEINVTAVDIYQNQSTQSFKIYREGEKIAAPPIVVPSPEIKGKYYALIIGINDYKYIEKLAIAKKDAIAVEKLLKEMYGFETRLLMDATRLTILNAINDFRKKIGEEDSFLIYYAGHGDYDKVADKAYWLPADAERDNPANWIMADDITTNIKRMASKHVLIISDSCYSGTFVRRVVSDLTSTKSDREGFIKRMVEKTSRTLMSSGGNEPVLDSGGTGHSVFAEAFLRGFREMDEKVFTADEIFYGVIRERVIGKADQTPQYNNIRNSGHEGGDFVFIKR